MTSFFVRAAQAAEKELADAGLSSVIDCLVCHRFTRKNLIQIHELARSCEICPGCYFLQGIIILLDQAGFNIPAGPWTPLLLTSWNLWGTEHFLTIARCERRPVDHWQVPTILEEANFIEVFKTPGMSVERAIIRKYMLQAKFKTPKRSIGEKCPWAKVPTARLASGNTGSQACMDLLRAQLDNCTQKHTFSKNNSAVVLPARLLEISATESGELAVRLAETNSKVGRYVCLSHKWIEGQTITTTTSNIDERRAGIPWNELPRTFREAVTVTHTLGFEYIWIDSLAINQDESSGDWLVEAPKMAQYYQNSSLTISAAEATEGLFCRLADIDQARLKVVPPERFKQSSYTIYVRKPLSHDTSALHHRGWVFQERILSPRIVHFGKELIWECAELTACECGRFPVLTKGGREPLRDVFDIGNVVTTYGRKQGHMMALSSTLLATGWCLLPQSVFIWPDAKSSRNRIKISHWLLTQKRLSDIDRGIGDHLNNPQEAQVTVADSQPQDVNDLTERPVLLQTGGVRKECRDQKESRLQASSAESGEHSKQETAESSSATSPESPEEEEEVGEEEILVSPPQPLAHSRWLDIVAHYTRRKLTFGTDIFPALAGLAKQFHPIFDCDYYAGLWKDTFIIDLLWRSRDPTNHPSLQKWRAPSWSWASTTAAVDYYHLLMAFELESHTFRYSISHSFIDEIQVDCVPLISNDLTMRLRSARVTLTGVLFKIALAPTEEKPEQRTVEEIEGRRSVVEEAISLPSPDIAEDDIRYFPLTRCMDNVQEVSWLAHDTGLDFITKKNNKKEVRQVLDTWWDHKQDADAQTTEAGKLKTYDCLLIARHESTMDTAYFSLLLKRTDEAEADG